MNILLGISGGISSYKACDVVSKLKYRNHSVRAIMTKNAERFITTVTLASLTGKPVLKDFWAEAEGGEIDHINVTQQWADCLIIAPATANIIGKFANGIADDYLSTVFMAAYCPKIIVPAMNTTMWGCPAMQRNAETLEKDGCYIMVPDEGKLACGTVGPGKLPKPEAIVQFLESLAKDNPKWSRK